ALFSGPPRVRRALLPAPVRRARARRSVSIDLPWLRPPARSALRSALAVEQAAQPVRRGRWVLWEAGRRPFEVLKDSADALALDAGANLVHPFLDPGFVAALAADRSRPRSATRTEALRALLEGLLSDAVLLRTDKAD